jgi:GTP-binding protein
LDFSLIQWLRDLSMSALIVLTKADKLSKNKIAQVRRQTAEALGIDPTEICMFSAHTGQGKKELWQKILHFINVP